MSRLWKERKNVLILAGLLLGQLGLLSLQVPLGDAPSLFEKAAFALAAPVLRAVQGVVRTCGGLWSGYIDLRGVENRNRDLQDEVLRLRQENVRLQAELRRLADGETASAHLRPLGKAFVLASVIGVDIANPYRSIQIDRGAARGLGVNMAVLDARGRLVGRIIPPVGKGEATVQLVTDDGSAVSVVTETSRVLGILSGDGKTGQCRLKYVPATNESVREGEVLLTSGFDRVFPPGLRVARVLSVRPDASLFKRIVAVPFFEFPELRIVAVLFDEGGGGEPGRP
ncbi:MAG: rod shape-determining protein MreC [Candidatus Aminicenantes bacterium]|nr:rod shape-determining protein MreC [Candidatus Aminicenantes bacterium]